MDLAGLPVTLLDTAGLRDTEDRVEQIGVARAKERSGSADLRVLLVTPDAPEPPVEPMPGDIVVHGKADLGAGPGLAVSGKTGAGINALVDAITGRLGDLAAGSATATRLRHRVAIDEARTYLSEARREVLSESPRVEYAAEDVYRALRALDALLGRVDVEQVLDVIFASFCLGK